MMDTLVSVIVPTKNSAATLERCLKSIKEQTYPRIELIVVDNHSSDATEEMANRFADIVIVKGPERSTQRNIGAEMASGQFLLMIDSDMELSRNVVKSCVDVVRDDLTVKSVVVPEESFGIGFWARCKKLERSFYIEVPWIEAARFFSKVAYQSIGGYDESLVSGEDWDLSRRVGGLGKVGRINEFIYHNEGAISLWGTLKKKYYYGRNAKAYLIRNPEKSKLSAQAGPIQRYRLFLSDPRKLFANPSLGVGMLIMKTAEFVSGALGYVLSGSPQLTEEK